ncbi:response regulator [Trichlorobacter ammonificans]|uniref:Response regulator receiver protein n=1 Tax=Trichlorobacter ammonificans TaxID=2916410 RepID=A0ABN8HGW6_9BACT|nr:response regulator [Trichlorobacter ammonificans]CAH2030716.1 Response regulator receiver protein [Trichlorobacter ammonificans]
MGSINILLADDSITIRKVVGIIFSGGDYSLTMVENGAAAIEKAREIRPDILLIDVLMPDLSGYEVCEAIRREPALAATPILLMTGSFEPFDEERARQCGASDHIVKPFEAQQLVAKVQELHERAAELSVAAPPEPAEPSFFEPTAVAPPAEPLLAANEPSPFESTFQQLPVASPDDPWGAFTLQPDEPAAAEPVEVLAFEPPPAEPAAVPAEPSPFEHSSFGAMEPPDVLEMLQDDLTPAAQSSVAETGMAGSWMPSDDQTFEFQEEVAVAPAAALGNPLELEKQLPEQEPAFDPTAFEPTAPGVPVVETVAEVPPQAVTPVVPAAVPALTEEQLKAALAAASKETIERIVWEVVPDLAESLIREAIRKITDGK